MRESNFAFPAQNKACVCITSQLYDRRALDTTSALPLFNSLTHLTYLTSTSPRIREIMTMDGGLERLVRILHDFCICPPPPENPAILYGLSPPNSRSPKLVPTLNPQSFDKHAAYRFSLAFQCIVNIGVRGSEPIRSRVVQAGTLDVVGCILEAWLANKGFAVGPSSSATGMPRETREQRLARRLEQRHREEAAELARALQRQFQAERDSDPSSSDFPQSAVSLSDPSSSTEDASTDTSAAATPVRSNTPTGVVLVPSRERSGTVIGRPIWDQPTRNQRRQLTPDSLSRPDTEEEDNDGDVDMDRAQDAEDALPPPRPRHQSLRRSVVGIISDTPTDTALDTDAHIIINDARRGVVGGDGGLGEAGGVEDGIVSLEANDDFAMGAPPGAPGAIELDEGADDRDLGRRDGPAPDVTPRATPIGLPLISPPPGLGRTGTINAAGANAVGAARAAHRARAASENITTTAPTRAMLVGAHHHHHHHRDPDSGPYRDEDVLLSLQLLAYLSKYPHVRQAFYKPRTTFHPASANLPGPRSGQPQHGVAGPSRAAVAASITAKEQQQHGFFRSFAASRGKEKEKPPLPLVSSSTTTASSPVTVRHTNVFSLVERFTFRPSSSESNMPNPPPQLPPEIQYWAGVIMRNACRKDENRGGIRQCANMLCGKWEMYPREFAKCRRCRKAKYCGKECQSTAWSEGHRFWCSAKEADGDGDADETQTNADGGEENGEALELGESTTAPTITHLRTERRGERERHAHGQARERAIATLAAHGGEPARNALAALRGIHRTTLSTTLRSVPQDPNGQETVTGRTAAARQAAFLHTLQSFGRVAPTTHPSAGTDFNMDQLAHRMPHAATLDVDQIVRRRQETTGARTGRAMETRGEPHPQQVAMGPNVEIFTSTTAEDGVAAAGGRRDDILDMVD